MQGQTKQVFFQFHFYRNQIASDKFYYRLVSKDADGKVSYSFVITVKKSGFEVNEIKAFPNPFTSTITLSGNWDKQVAISIRLLDPAGKQIWSRKAVPDRNTPLILSNLEHLAPGLYNLVISDGIIQHSYPIFK